MTPASRSTRARGRSGWCCGRARRAAARSDAAAEIAAALKRRAHIVGVFVNATLEHVTAVSERIGLTALQLHGDEGPSFCSEAARRTGCKVIKALRVRSRADVQALRPFHTDFHLLDSYVPERPGGSGETFEWELARAHRGPVPMILSGGLTPDNVAQAIESWSRSRSTLPAASRPHRVARTPISCSPFRKQVAGAHVRRPRADHDRPGRPEHVPAGTTE